MKIDGRDTEDHKIDKASAAPPKTQAPAMKMKAAVVKPEASHETTRATRQARTAAKYKGAGGS